jgi:GMP reductase
MSRINTKPQYDFNDVLFEPRNTTLNSRKEVCLERTFVFNEHTTWTGIPIIAANMYTTGTFEVHNVLNKFKILTAMHKFYNVDDYKKNKFDPEYLIVSTGIHDKDYDNLTSILDTFPIKWICIDVANGYIPNMVEFCRKVRDKYPYHIIIGGNVANALGVKLLSPYLNIIKVGIGPGSVCTTRKMTGVGIPQLSCIMDCAEELHKYSDSLREYGFKPKYIIGDGGITCPGDVSKAFGAGADFVMMGGAFAGHDENPGITIEKNGKSYKQFYGMSSSYAMETHYGKKDNYRASEGKIVEIPYKGKLEDTVNEYLGGIRSTCTYIGAKSISDIYFNTYFIVVKNQINGIYDNTL